MRAAGMRITVLVFSALLVACGGGGGSAPRSPTVADGPATVGVLITDAPSAKWDEAIATITSVRLIGDSGQVVLFSGSQTLDLLKLRDFSELFAVSDDVPPGSYSKIRLQLSDLVLNDLDPDSGAIIESVHPRLTGNGKLDLNPRTSIVLASGDVVFVQLDFDMDKSLKLTETGNGRLILRPVVFVDIRAERPLDRLSRIHGEITEVDLDGGTFRLCQTEFASAVNDDDAAGAGDDITERRCVTVNTDAATGIFDADGMPQGLDGLAVGEEATVIGRLQPLPDDNEVSGASEDDHFFAFDAYVVEEGVPGTYARVRGTAASPVDELTSRFDLDVAADQGLGSATTLPVQLYEKSRIFNRDGDELSRGDITAGRNALVDGVLIIGDEDLIRSPLVILGALAPPPEITLQGMVVSVDATAGTLVVNDGTMDRCVNAAEADIFLVDDSDGISSTRGGLADLEPGQSVALFGVEDGGCFTASTILADL